MIAIAVSGSDVYVGGNFTNVNNSGTVLAAADYVAKWDGSNWSALGSNGAGNGSLGTQVNALAVSGSDVYVGGFFTDVNNGGTVLTAADYVAKWDGANWSALGSDGAGGGSIGSIVNAIAVSGTDVYVGGYFTDVNNGGSVLTAADYVAKWDGANWSALGSNGAGDGSLNNLVEALAISGSNLYASGNFSDVNNNGTVLTAADHIAKWDGTNWSALGSNGAGDGSVVASTNSNYPAIEAVAANGSYVYIGGEFFNVNDNGTSLPYADYLAAYHIPLTMASFTSIAAQDGWILESSETSNAGGSLNSTGNLLQLGDDAANRQYRVILSFNTASLPDNAVVQSAVLQIKQNGVPVGTNPFNILGNLLVDIQTGHFGSGAVLQLTDFGAAASASKVAHFIKTPVMGWYSTAAMTATGLGKVNRAGTTQFRLYFAKDDNNDHLADYMKFLSGNFSSNQPVLIIGYSLP